MPPAETATRLGRVGEPALPAELLTIMKRMSREERVHVLFKIGVVIKGVDGIIEVLTGTALLFTSVAALRGLVDALTQGELLEDPTDFVATHLVAFFHHLSLSSKYFAAVYLLLHGVVKVGLVAGLLRGKIWAYPTALGVLGLFLCYQAYRYGHNPSLGLALVSLLDLAVLALIGREYRRLKACPRPV